MTCFGTALKYHVIFSLSESTPSILFFKSRSFAQRLRAGPSPSPPSNSKIGMIRIINCFVNAASEIPPLIRLRCKG